MHMAFNKIDNNDDSSKELNYENSFPMDRFRMLSGGPVEAFMQNVLDVDPKDKDAETLRCILYNALHTYYFPDSWIAYSRDRNYYVKKRYKALRFRLEEVTKTIEWLKRDGWIVNQPGFWSEEFEFGRCSRFRATRKLRDKFQKHFDGDVEITVTRYLSDCLIVRTFGETKERVPLDSTAFTRKLEANIQYNNLRQMQNNWELRIPASRCQLTHEGIEVTIEGEGTYCIPRHLIRCSRRTSTLEELRSLTTTQDQNSGVTQISEILTGPLVQKIEGESCGPTLHISLEPIWYRRIFKKEGRACFKKHGRWYNKLQSLPSGLRPFLYVNGLPTVEFDYASTHPSMLLAEKGLEADQEIYDIPGADVPRDLCKVIALVCINASSNVKKRKKRKKAKKPKAAKKTQKSRTAKKGGKRKSRKPNPKKKVVVDPVTRAKKKAVRALIDPRSGHRHEAYQEYKKRPDALSPEELIERYTEAHPEISREGFFSDRGNDLMRKDSEIVGSVVTEASEKDIPCQAIHDSFVVPAVYADWLHQKMKQAWFDEVGQAALIKRVEKPVIAQQDLNLSAVDPGQQVITGLQLGACDELREWLGSSPMPNRTGVYSHGGTPPRRPRSNQLRTKKERVRQMLEASHGCAR